MKTERNKERFPEEFCFQLNSKEFAEAKSQNENLIVLYKNNTKYDEKIREIEKRLLKIEKENR